MARSVFAFFCSVARLRLPAQSAEGDRPLELCALCRRDFVNPVDWEPVGPEHWWMLLRCGECGTWCQVMVTNAVARRYDAELNRRVDILAALWDRLDRERMIGEAEALTTALRLDLIDAADFATERNGGCRPSG